MERVYVQAKRWADTKVSSKEVRDFIGSLSLRGTNKGVFITTSDFTQDALNTVNINPAKPDYSHRWKKAGRAGDTVQRGNTSERAFGNENP